MSRKSRKGGHGEKPVDVKRLRRLVEKLLTTDYGIPWYRPNAADTLPWEHIQESFRAGYDAALEAVLQGLRGDGGRAMKEILDGEVIIVRTDDVEEYQEKMRKGAPTILYDSLTDSQKKAYSALTSVLSDEELFDDLLDAPCAEA